jgi:dihydroxy-acid dehydratase
MREKTELIEKNNNGSLSTNGHSPRVGIIVAAEDDLSDPLPWQKNILFRVTEGVRQAGGAPHTLILSGWGKKRGGQGAALHSSRALISDAVDFFVRGGEPLKGLVLIADGNAQASALLSGAARVDVPAVLVPLWPDAKKDYASRSVLCLAEVMGLAQVASSTLSSVSPEAAAQASDAGAKVVEWGRKRWSIRSGLLPNAFGNAFRFDSALGGSVEGYLFLAALAQEGGVRLDRAEWFTAARQVPQVCLWDGKTGRQTQDVQAAGGLAGIAAHLLKIWLPQASVDGKTVVGLAKTAKVKPSPVFVRPSSKYVGGLRLLKGNLARGGALCHLGEAAQKSAVFSGPVAVFNSLEDAQSALIQKMVKKGDVIVVRYEGPGGGRHLRPLGAPLMDLMKKQSLAPHVAVVTDGVWGAGERPAWVVELISPEASAGAALSVLRAGDKIDINAEAGTLLAHLTETDLNVRMTRWKAEGPPDKSGFGARYARQSGTAIDGAVLR